VIVQVGRLIRQPAEQPHIHRPVAVQQRPPATTGIKADERPPPRLLGSNVADQGDEFRQFEGAW
jgi:hypothetical protein